MKNISKELIFNENQFWSETDSFTTDRYLQFSEYFNGRDWVLDIGCNTGRGGEIIKNKFPEINLVGIDIISTRLNKIQSGIYTHLECISILEFNTKFKFDYIVAGEVIEHIPKDEFLEMLLKCSDLLKEGGKILFTTPNPESLLVKLGRRKVFDDPSHINLMNIQTFKSIVNNSKLTIVELKGSGKMTNFIKNCSILSLYGSYLAVISK